MQGKLELVNSGKSGALWREGKSRCRMNKKPANKKSFQLLREFEPWTRYSKLFSSKKGCSSFSCSCQSCPPWMGPLALIKRSEGHPGLTLMIDFHSNFFIFPAATQRATLHARDHAAFWRPPKINLSATLCERIQHQLLEMDFSFLTKRLLV